MKKIFALLLLVATLSHAGQSTSFIFTPSCGMPQGMQAGNSIADGTDGIMWCVSFVPCMGITNATKIAIWITGDSAVTTVPSAIGVAYYDSSGNPIVRANKTYSTNLTLVEFSGGDLTIPASGTSFTLTAGTNYYQCYCSAETSGAGTNLMNAGGAPPSAFFNEFASSRWGSASNLCNTTSALPPATMGSLTSASGPRFMVMEAGTATP